jgi:pimeloyl-ACP methyl ester carboxylesterase
MEITMLRSLFLFLLFLSLGSQAAEVTLPHHGLTLNGQLQMAKGKSLKEGVVLVLHGTLSHNRTELIEGIQKQLTERGHNTLAINLSLGVDNRHGTYDCATPTRHKHTDALDELSAWMTWLKTQGTGPVTLIGHSRGGNQIAWFAAERMNPAIRKVVLLAPQTWPAGYAAKTYQKRYGTDLAPLLDKMAKADTKALLGPVDFLYCPKTRVSAGSFVNYYTDDRRFDTPGLLATIRVPVLVIAAEGDEIVPGLVERVQPQADGQRIQLKVLAGADHFFRDLYSEDAVEAIQAFLSTP